MFDVTLFLEQYPEFASLTPSSVQTTGDNVDLLLSDNTWGKYRNMGLFLYTAHKLAVRYNISRKELNAAGVKSPNSAIITSKSASGSSLSDSVELNAMTRSENPMLADFGRTTYGLEYLSLIQQIMSRGDIVQSKGVINAF